MIQRGHGRNCRGDEQVGRFGVSGLWVLALMKDERAEEIMSEHSNSYNVNNVMVMDN